MIINFKVESISREWVIAGIYRITISAKSYATSITLDLSNEEYEALDKAIGPIKIGTIIPIEMPGEVIYEDEV